MFDITGYISMTTCDMHASGFHEIHDLVLGDAPEYNGGEKLEMKLKRFKKKERS